MARWTLEQVAKLGKARIADMNSEEFRQYNLDRFDTPAKPNGHPESDLQQACVSWFRAEYPQYEGLLIASLNGAKLPGSPKKRAATATRLKKEGMVPGVADLFLAIPAHGSPGLWLEMKVPGKYQNPGQREWQAIIESAGYPYTVPKTLEAFSMAIINYLKTGKP